MQPSRLHLFQSYGIELEYMIVERDTLQVKPIADELLRHEIGSIGSDFENGTITWSNELVLHVLEVKCSQPEHNFSALENAFSENIRRINAILSGWNAMLLPTASHPLMDPLTETKLWPHDNHDVYDIYNKIFDCKGHGWSNVQSTHLNLPFYDDEEFAKLHATIRLILPILPALCASSPILDGRITGAHDTRLQFYKTNQSRIPCITGKVIPEAIFSKRNYVNAVYDKIKHEIAPFDPEGILNPVWVNSRGAIPRFDRGSIEIRVMDIQECPAADMAIVTLVIETLKALASGFFISADDQIKWKTEPLVNVFDTVWKHGETALLPGDYCSIFDSSLNTGTTASNLWKAIVGRLIKRGNNGLETWKRELDVILNDGTLSTRILQALGSTPSRDSIVKVYKMLADCLAQNKQLIL